MAEHVPGAGVGEVGGAVARGEAHATSRRDGDPAVAEHVLGAGLQRPQAASRAAQSDEAGREQGGAALAAAGSVAGLHRVERARITAAADGTGCGQDTEEVDQSGIEPSHDEVDGVCEREKGAGEGS